MSFELGEILVTRTVYDKMKVDKVFRKEVYESLERYKSKDWGETCKTSIKHNRIALQYGNCFIFAAYYVTEVIWIITNEYRSRTTIMFRDEYSVKLLK